jgi:hypothetical protein
MYHTIIKAAIGYGYFIKDTDYPTIDEDNWDAYDDWREKLHNSDYYYPLNDFDGDGDFFGIILKEVESGTAIEFDIEDLTEDINDEWNLCYEIFTELFPNYEDLPNFYLLCSVL